MAVLVDSADLDLTEEVDVVLKDLDLWGMTLTVLSIMIVDLMVLREDLVDTEDLEGMVLREGQVDMVVLGDMDLVLIEDMADLEVLAEDASIKR
jgi:hypothetical protein